ncbi:hypothetical protein ACSNOD_32005, partial [Streptomyces sp. URMC 123]
EWSAAPGAADGDAQGAARPAFALEGGPGAVLRDTLALTNRGDRPRTVALRPADLHNGDGGALAVRPPGRSTGLGTWVALASERVT